MPELTVLNLPSAARRLADGDPLAAIAHDIAATALRGHARGEAAALAGLVIVAHGYFMKGDHGLAQAWYELLLALDELEQAEMPPRDPRQSRIEAECAATDAATQTAAE